MYYALCTCTCTRKIKTLDYGNRRSKKIAFLKIINKTILLDHIFFKYNKIPEPVNREKNRGRCMMETRPMLCMCFRSRPRAFGIFYFNLFSPINFVSSKFCNPGLFFPDPRSFFVAYKSVIQVIKKKWPKHNSSILCTGGKSFQ